MKIMVINDNEILTNILKKIIGNSECIIVDTKNKKINQILNEIKNQTETNNIDAIFINAHFKCEDYQGWQCGGIELLKHIRLTEELGNVCLLPIILGTLLPVDCYIHKSIDNLIIFSPGCECLFLQELSQETFDSAINRIRTKIGAERFSSFEEMRKKLKDYIIFTPIDKNYFNPEEPTTHDIRDKIGPRMLIKEFCPESEENNFLQEYEDPQADLAFKKAKFLGIIKSDDENQLMEHDHVNLDQELKRLAKDKKFLFIEDHPSGWLEALYCVLFGKKI